MLDKKDSIDPSKKNAWSLINFTENLFVYLVYFDHERMPSYL